MKRGSFPAGASRCRWSRACCWSLLLAFLVFRFFLLTFTIAGSLALLLAPAQRSLTRRLGGRQSLAAGLLTLLVIAALLVPLLSYGTIVAQQATGVVDWVRPHLEPAAFDQLWRETLPQKYPLVMAWVRRATGGTAMSTASTVLSTVTSEANHLAQSFLAGLATVLLDFGIFVLMLFFLLRDGEEIREAASAISPLTRGQELDIVDHLTRTVKGVLQSMVLVPIAQGIVAFFGFWIFGVPSPLLWSLMVVFAALIPILGSPLAWVPAVLYLLSQGGDRPRDRAAALRRRAHQRHRQRGQAAHPEGRRPDPHAARVPVDPGRGLRLRTEGPRSWGRSCCRWCCPRTGSTGTTCCAGRSRRTSRCAWSAVRRRP